MDVTIQLRDLTNVQFSIPNVHPMGRRLRILCRLLSPRMRIEHCELSIGQIYQNVLNSYEWTKELQSRDTSVTIRIPPKPMLILGTRSRRSNFCFPNIQFPGTSPNEVCTY